MSTTEALKKLAARQVQQVCLLHGGRFTALVSYDPIHEELVFRFLDPQHRLTVRALLFQTFPAWVI